MKLTENSDEIIIRHVPVEKWIGSGILTFIFGGFFIWLIYSASNNQNSPIESGSIFWLDMLPLLVLLAAVLVVSILEISFVSMIFAPLTTVTISEKTKSVDILYQRFYGNKIKRHFFHNVEKFKSYKGTLNFSSRYFLALVLVNRKTIKLKIPIGRDKQEIVKHIKKLNKFMKARDLQKSISNR